MWAVAKRWIRRPFCREFPLFVGGHEGRGEPESAETEATLGASADVVDDGDCSFVQLFLVVILVFYHIQVDKIAQVCTGIPSHVVRINVDLS